MNFFNNLFGGNNNNNNNNNNNGRNNRRERRQQPSRQNSNTQNNRNGQRSSTSTNSNPNSNRNRSANNTNNPRPRQAQPQPSPRTESTQNQRRQQQQQQQAPPQQHYFQVPPGMEHIFAQIFANSPGFNPETFFGGGEPPFSSNAPPPASDKAIRTLPTVMVTPEDLVDENNRECCICFEPHNLGDKVTRLPCAHIFHPQCINEWLTKHCTCPICRYELPTTNQTYESGRQERMAARKPRFASYELQRMKISELMDLCQHKLKIPIVGSGYTKQEIIDLIVQSGKIDVISAPPPVSVENISSLRGMGVGKLKRLMKDAGVFFDSRDVIEKEDMVQIFINSGRVVFEEEEQEEEEEEKVEEMEEDVNATGQYATANTGAEEEKEEIEVKRARISSDEEGDCISASTRTISYENLKNDDNFKSEEVQVVNDEQQEGVEVQVSSASTSANSSQNGGNDEPMAVDVSGSLSDDGGQYVPLIPTSTEGNSTTEATPTETNNTNSAPPRTTSPSTSYSYNESADISSRSIGELKELGRALNVDLSNCLEKREMIQRIVNSLSRSGVGTRYGGGVVS